MKIVLTPGTATGANKPMDVSKLIEIGSVTVVWLVTIVVLWTKLTDRVDGFGDRVKVLESNYANQDGRMDRFERELNEYRRDALEGQRAFSRVEKSVDEVHEIINQGNLTLGSQLSDMQRMIQDKDTRTQVRLTRIETVTRVEAKIGPLPIEP